MKLYHHPASANCRKCLLVSEHLGLDLDREIVDILKGENKKPEFLKLNPNAKIPLLVDGSLKLWESNAIMAYLASHQDNTLWPKSNARYDIMRWQHWESSHFKPAIESIVFERVFKKFANLGEPDAAAIKRGEENLDRYGAVLNGHLETHDWVVGKNLSLADFALAANLTYHPACAIEVGQL